MVKTVHDMMPNAHKLMAAAAFPTPPKQIEVWSYAEFMHRITSSGQVSYSPDVAGAVQDFLGFKVVCRPSLPAGRVEFRNADGSLAYALDVNP